MIATRIRGVESSTVGERARERELEAFNPGLFARLRFFSCESLEGKCALLSLLLCSRTDLKASSGISEVKSAQMSDVMREIDGKRKIEFSQRL